MLERNDSMEEEVQKMIRRYGCSAMTVESTMDSQPTVIIEEIERTVIDIVSNFVAQPDVAVHEGIARPLVIALESALLNGIIPPEQNSDPIENEEWVDQGYWKLLKETKNVLRDDHGITDKVQAYVPPQNARYVGWGHGRAMIFMALNENLLGKAIENLIKRRTLLENLYSPNALLCNFDNGMQIVAFLTALNGVKFSLSLLTEDIAVEFPSTLKQSAYELYSSPRLHSMTFFTSSSSPNDVKTFQECGPCRFLLFSTPMNHMFIARGSFFELPLIIEKKDIVVWQFLLKHHDISFSIFVNGKLINQSVRFERSECYREGTFCPNLSTSHGICTIKWDNAYSYIRGKELYYRAAVVKRKDYFDALSCARDAAEALSWKSVLNLAILRVSSEQLQLQQEEEMLMKEYIQSKVSDKLDAEKNNTTSLIEGTLSYVLGSSPWDEVKHCALCRIEFSLFRRKSQCIKCEKHYCLDCSRHTMNTIKYKGRVCDRCFLDIVDERNKQLDKEKSEHISGDACNPEYAGLKNDPELVKYFKMLTVGVPHSAVAQKMVQDMVDQAIVDIFAKGPEGNETLWKNPNSSKTTTTTTANKAQSTTTGINATLRRIHWKSLDDEKAQKSVWQRQTYLRRAVPAHVSALEKQELQDLFAVKSDVQTTDSKSKKKRKKGFGGRLLDPRRSNNISIGLSQFKSFGGADLIVKSLSNADTDVLTTERLLSLVDLVPSEIEVRRLGNYRGNMEALGEPEKFLFEMMKVSRPSDKVVSLLYIAQFNEQAASIQQQLNTISEGCHSILNSERFARVLETILVLGNLMNIGTEREEASGITLDSLQKLSETKSIDGSTTLLDFFVQIVQEKGEGEILNFPDDMKVLNEAKRLSNAICMSSFKSLEKGFQALQKELKHEKNDDTRKHEESEEQRRNHILQLQEKARQKKLLEELKIQRQREETCQKEMYQEDQRLQFRKAHELENNYNKDLNGGQGERKQGAACGGGSGSNAAAVGSNAAAAGSNAAAAGSNAAGSNAAAAGSNAAGESGDPRKNLLAAITNFRKEDRGMSFKKTNTQHHVVSTKVKQMDHEDDEDALKSNVVATKPVLGGGSDDPRKNLLAAINNIGKARQQQPHHPPSFLHDIGRNKQMLGGINRGGDDVVGNRSSLLAAIRAGKSKKLCVSKGDDDDADDVDDPLKNVSMNPSDYVFVPTPYVCNNHFIKRLESEIPNMSETIQCVAEDLGDTMELCNEVAAYLGENSSTTTSDYMFTTLYEFIQRIISSIGKRKSLFKYHQQQVIGRVGQVVPTLYGTSVIQAIRMKDDVYTVKYPWGTGYLAASSFLRCGQLVTCKYGTVVLEENRWDQGLCVVRLSWGRAILDVKEINYCKAQPTIVNSIYKKSLCGDPVITLFGEGRLRYRRRSKNRGDRGDGIVVVSFFDGMRGFCQAKDVSNKFGKNKFAKDSIAQDRMQLAMQPMTSHDTGTNDAI